MFTLDKVNPKVKIFALVVIVLGFFSVVVSFTNSLAKLPKTIIKTSPSGATIYINNKDYGHSPVTLELRPGTYKIKLTAEYYKTLEQTLEVTRKDSTKTFELKKTYALPYENDNYSIDCTNLVSNKICSINIYNSPVKKFEQEAREYLKKTNLKIDSKDIIVNDMTNNPGGIPG